MDAFSRIILFPTREVLMSEPVPINPPFEIRTGSDVGDLLVGFQDT